MVEAVAGSVISGVLTNKILGGSKSKANQIAGGIVPNNVNTGMSSYNTQTGTLSIDPTIRNMQESSAANIMNLQGDTNTMFGDYRTGLAGIQGGVDELRSSFEGNQSAYRDQMLNPVREALAAREGALTKELGRTNVRGSFRDQSLTNFATDKARTLRDAEAKIENERINKLGDFLQMDADILKQGLASDQGRVNMLAALEQSLSGISMDRFNQEMSMLKLPSTFIPGTTAAAGIKSNAQGVFDQAAIKGVGEIIGAIGDNWGNNESAPSNYDQDSLFWE